MAEVKVQGARYRAQGTGFQGARSRSMVFVGSFRSLFLRYSVPPLFSCSVAPLFR